MCARYAPILIFAFNRPERLSCLLSSLQSCPEFATSPVRIFIDGPRSATDVPLVDQTYDVARSAPVPDLQVVRNDTNTGLKASVMRGVTAGLDLQDRAIILEDDLVVSPQALTYFNAALEKYNNEDRVWSVSGYMYDVPALESRREAFFVPFSHPWGWATWRDPWQRFVTGTRDLSMISSKSFQTYFDALGVRDFTSILELDTMGLVNSWYLNWYFEMFLRGGITLAPPVSLIQNDGLNAGTHASVLNPYRFLQRRGEIASVMPDLPDEVVLDFRALDALRAAKDVKLQKAISQMGRIKRLGKRTLSQVVERWNFA